MELRERWLTGRLPAVGYDVGVQNRAIARVAGRVLWGYDVARLWESIGLLRGVRDGTAVLDVPCGGGLAFRALPPGGRVRYVAADLSPVMLGRARGKARRLGLDQVALVQADAGALPFPDASFDLCLSYNGLHCLPAPRAAVAEIARVLRPGGTLRGTTVVRGAGRRQDAAVAFAQRYGAFGPGGRPSDLVGWLADAGLADIRIERSGAVAHFTAHRLLA